MTCEVEQFGYSWARGFLTEEEIGILGGALGNVTGAGRRGVLEIPEVRVLAGSEQIRSLVQRFVGGRPRPVRAIFFNKSSDSNWLVSWHQDLSIAVKERIEIAGFGPWSVKEGVCHVQPPDSVLERMITLRIHLDDADETNGALKVLPGTHCLGRLSADEIGQCRSSIPETLCQANRGDALLMRPMILHASSRSTVVRPRRILHIEYASQDLPSGLEWYDDV